MQQQTTRIRSSSLWIMCEFVYALVCAKRIALNSRLSQRSSSTARLPSARRRSTTRWRFARWLLTSAAAASLSEAVAEGRSSKRRASRGSRTCSCSCSGLEGEDDEAELTCRRRAAFEMRTAERSDVEAEEEAVENERSSDGLWKSGAWSGELSMRQAQSARAHRRYVTTSNASQQSTQHWVNVIGTSGLTTRTKFDFYKIWKFITPVQVLSIIKSQNY